MIVKSRMALTALLVFGLSIPASAAIIQMADYIEDPGFDNTNIVGLPGTGESPDTYYHTLSYPQDDLISGWSGAGMGYAYIFQTKTGIDREDTPEQMSVMSLPWGSYDIRMWTDVNTTLVNGNTYQVRFKTRAPDLPNDPVWGPVDLDVSLGFYDGTLFYTASVPVATSSWQSFTYSFTFNEADHAADAKWALVFRAMNPPENSTGRVMIDSLSAVPEPSSLLLLGIGGIGLLAYAWRKRR